MTAVTVVAPLLGLFLASGLLVDDWTPRLWAGLTVGIGVDLVLNLAVFFR